MEEEVSAKLQQDTVEKDKAMKELEQMLAEATVERHKHQTTAKRLENQVQHLKASLDGANVSLLLLQLAYAHRPLQNAADCLVVICRDLKSTIALCL